MYFLIKDWGITARCMQHRLRLIAFIMGLLCLNVAFAQDQNKAALTTVKGTVSDTEGQPLPGVTVQIRGKSVAAITNDDGKYQINVPDVKNGVLVFSEIGFITRNVTINDRITLNVTLTSENKSLDEVVVIGYGTTKKSDLTASVSSVSQEALSQRTLLSLADAIKGKAAGVEITQNDGTPGTDNTIRIRGASSVSASSTPLYVVDGIMQDDINNVSPGDIQSVEILKDASGTAIYGSRGANGVILITTKSGKIGKTRVELYTNTGFQKPGHLYGLMNSQQYAHNVFLASSYTYSPASTSNPDVPATTLGGYTYYRATPLGTPGGFWGVQANGPYHDWQNYASPDSANTDWQNALFQNGVIQEHRISVTGGNKDTRYAFLGGYLNQDGLIVFSGYQRYNGRFNYQQNLSKTLKLTANIIGNRSITNGYTPSISALNGGVASNAIITSMLLQPPVNKLTFTDIEDNEGVDGYITSNPYSLAKYITNDKYTSEWTSRLGLDWAITKNLSFRSTGTYTNINSNTDAYYPTAVASGAKFNGRGIISRGSTGKFMNEDLLYYKLNINKDHKLNLMGGAVFEQNKYNLITAENQNYDIETLGAHGLSNGTSPIIPTYNITEWSMVSFLSRAEYNYKQKYLLTATMRADGSSRFSKTNKWGYFPSVALAWRMSEEDIFKKIKAISNLKLRLSAGQSGNTAIPSYLTLSTIATYFSPMDGATPNYGVVVERPENLSLKWETTTQYNAGIDLGLFKERFTLTAEAYLKRTKDLLIQKITPGYSGYRTTWTNLGSVQNKGIELTVNGIIIDRKEFNWNASANIGFNRSKAIDIGAELLLDPGVVASIGNSAIIRNGESLGQWFGYQTDGIYQSDAEIKASGITNILGQPTSERRPGTRKYVDQNGDHIIDTQDRIVLGQGQPLYTGGFTNSISYKNFTLNAVVQYSYGNKIYNANKVASEASLNRYNTRAVYTNAWTPSLYNSTTGELLEAGNPNNQYRMPGSPAELFMTSDWIEDGSFLRLSDITLSYDFRLSTLKKIGIKGLTLFTTGKNLWIWTNYTGYDPEVSTRQGGFGDLMPSLDYASYPRSRVFSFGLKAQF